MALWGSLLREAVALNKFRGPRSGLQTRGESAGTSSQEAEKRAPAFHH